MAKKEPVNIFISHCGEDADQLENLRNLLKAEGYEVRDSSIDERHPNNAKDPEYIKSLIRPKIDWAGKVLILIGPETHTKEWVDWEIEYANKNGDKRIVGIYVKGGTDADVPKNLKIYGDALIAWNSGKLVSAIEGKNLWFEPDGSRSRGFWPKDRSVC
jgi:hypothetical protein